MDCDAKGFPFHAGDRVCVSYIPIPDMTRYIYVPGRRKEICIIKVSGNNPDGCTTLDIFSQTRIFGMKRSEGWH